MQRTGILVLLMVLSSVANAEVTVEKLTWAGIKLEHSNTTVFIDAVGTDLWQGNAPGGLIPLEASTQRRYALVSHTHNDHFDPAALMAALGERGYVIAHEDEAVYIASRGLQVIPAKMWTPVTRGGFIFTAVPAGDGLGDSQVNWVISVADKRYFHGGDTLWHGGWDVVGRQFGPFDLVFLPINGAKVLREPMPESVATLTPLQAIDAALLLKANAVLPIHYGLNDPPYYVEVENNLDQFLMYAERRAVTVHSLQPGEQLVQP